MSPEMIGIVGAAVVVFLILCGIPVAVSLGAVGAIGLMVLRAPSLALSELGMLPYATTKNFILLVIPLFIMMGHLAYQAGVTTDAFSTARKWFSSFPAGLGLATIVGCAGFGAACGVSAASAATMGRIAIPEMERQGYDSELACGTVAAGGLLAIMIPPSITMVIYASLAETSVGAQLIAGVIPGLLTVLVFMMGLLLMARLRPGMAPPGESIPWRERILALGESWRMLVLIAIVIGGMYAGVFTPTEAGAGGAFATLLMVLAQREKLGFKLADAARQTVRTTAMIFTLLIGASLFSRFIVMSGLATAFAEWAGHVPVPGFVLAMLCLSVYIPLGMFMDGISMMLITLPLLFPVIVGQLGYSPIWFGVIVTKMIEIALITPPVGLNVYVVASVAPHVSMERIFRAIGSFLVMELVTLSLLFAFPVLSTWLPSTMYASAR